MQKGTAASPNTPSRPGIRLAPPRRERAGTTIPPKILLYSHDTFGLGNIRRTLLLAETLRHAHPGAAILLITGSPVIQSFRIPAGVDYVKLPCLDRTDADVYAPRFIARDREIADLRRAILAQSLLSFAPDLVVVDKRPSGIGGELADALELLDRLPRKPAMVLGLRDILDEPSRTRASLAATGAMDLIERYYDEVWVYGERAIFDAVAEYEFSPAVAARTRYCGYLRRPVEPRSAPAAAPRVLVTPGGGGDGRALITAYLEDLATLPRSVALHTTVVFGPEMPAEERQAFRGRFGALADVDFVDFELDMNRRYANADVAVTMAGYNTVCELLSFGLPAVLVPRTRPVREQWLRASALAREGLVAMVEPDGLEPGRLMAAVRDRLAQARSAPSLDMNGLPRILDRVRDLLGVRES
ncbi:MAG: glycosyltransferase [Vicinamibacterales bacterium]